MWNDHKKAMILDLQGPKGKKITKNDKDKKKKHKKLTKMGDEVREVALKSYFHYCKEQAAKKFIEWRID